MDDNVRYRIDKDIDHFDDVYHEYGDDHDEDRDRYVDFDNFYTYAGQDNYVDDADIFGFEDHQNILGKPMDISEPRSTPVVAGIEIKQEPIEEHLSQKLSQLSASDDPMSVTSRKRPATTPSKEATSSETISTTTKKFKAAEEDTKTQEWIRNYLTSSNKHFESVLQPVLKRMYNAPSLDDIQQVANILHQLKSIEFDRLLWNKYLQSGTGELIQQEDISVVWLSKSRLPTLQYWPLDVKQRMIKRGETKHQDPQKIDYETCLDYVQRVIAKFDQQTQFYHERFRLLRMRLAQRLTDELEIKITEYVRDFGMNLYRIHTEKRIAAIEFDYRDKLICMEFQREMPNAYQKATFESLFQSKRAAEEAKLNIAILKQRIVYSRLPRSFESIHIPDSIHFDSVRDNRTRQRLKDQCDKLIQRIASEFMLVSINIAEGLFEQNHKKFSQEMETMKKNQNDEAFYEKFTMKQMDMLTRRFRLLDDRLMAMYNLKLRFFVKAPTVTN